MAINFIKFRMRFYIIKKEVISYEKRVYSMWENSEGDNSSLLACTHRVNYFIYIMHLTFFILIEPSTV